MGVDLTILPVDYNIEGKRICHSQLQFERRRELWDVIREKVVTRKIDKPISCFLARNTDGERCYGEIMEDPYGEVLEVTTFNEFVRILEHQGFTGLRRNIAIAAFIEAMPSMDEVVLYWH